MATVVDYSDLLVSKAFLTSESRRLKDAVIYEVFLPEDKPWAYMRDQVYPEFTRFLKHNAIDPEDPTRVVVAVFSNDRCFLLEGRKFLDVFQDMEGMNSSALHFRILRWLNESELGEGET